LSRGGKKCSCQYPLPTLQAKVSKPGTGRCDTRDFAADELAAAREWRVLQKAKNRKGEAAAKESPRLEQYALEVWLPAVRAEVDRGKRKVQTVEAYDRHLRSYIFPRFGQTRLDDLRPGPLQELLDDLKAQGLSESTVDSAFTPLKGLVRFAVKREHTSSNRVVVDKDRVVSREKRTVELPVLVSMIAALPETERGVWATAGLAGLRRGELAALRPEDVDLTADTLEVFRALDSKYRLGLPKGGRGRKVLILDELRPFLRRQLLLADPAQDYLFGKPQRIFRAVEPARRSWKTHGLPTDMGLHHFRHCFTTYLHGAGVSTKVIDDAIEHVTPGLTLGLYVHVQASDRTLAKEQFSAYYKRMFVADDVAQAGIGAL